MNKSIISGIAVAAAVVVFGLTSTGVVHAQSDTTTTSFTSLEYGMGGRGRMGGGLHDGLLHDEMIALFAEKLGISVEDLNARLTAGETLYEISLAEGLSSEEFSTLMVDARNQAIDQAVADSTLTQTQADWMKSRATMMGTGNFGTRGTGNSGRSGFGTCMNP